MTRGWTQVRLYTSTDLGSHRAPRELGVAMCGDTSATETRREATLQPHTVRISPNKFGSTLRRSGDTSGEYMVRSHEVPDGYFRNPRTDWDLVERFVSAVAKMWGYFQSCWSRRLTSLGISALH